MDCDCISSVGTYDGESMGSRFQAPEHGKRLIIGALVVSAGASVATWDTYDNGFWEAKVVFLPSRD